MRKRSEMRKKKVRWWSLPAGPSSPAEGREAGSGKGLRVGQYPGSFTFVEDPGSPRKAGVGDLSISTYASPPVTIYFCPQSDLITPPLQKIFARMLEIVKSYVSSPQLEPAKPLNNAQIGGSFFSDHY